MQYNFKRFKIKYHPDDSINRKEELNAALKVNIFITEFFSFVSILNKYMFFCSYPQRRLEVFKELLANGKIDSVCVDADNPDPLVHLLDSVVIKLEGGTDFDLAVLNPKEMIKSKQEPASEKKESDNKTE